MKESKQEKKDKKRRTKQRKRGYRDTGGRLLMKGRGRKTWQGQGWREESGRRWLAAMPTIGANAVVTLATVGSGLCSSQGLPVKRVESSLQDVNKPRGRQGP